MVSKISRMDQTTQVQAQTTKNTNISQSPETNSTSIFDKSTNASSKAKHGKGLGVGHIPPGIQKKIDSGNVPPSLADKFKQIEEAIKQKEEASKPKEGAPLQGTPQDNQSLLSMVATLGETLGLLFKGLMPEQQIPQQQIL